MSKFIHYIQILILSSIFFVVYGTQAASTVTYTEKFKEVLDDCGDSDDDDAVAVDEEEEIEEEEDEGDTCDEDPTGTFSIVANVDLSGTGVSFTDLSEDTSVTLEAENFLFTTTLGEAEDYTSGGKKATFVVFIDEEDNEIAATVKVKATTKGVNVKIKGAIDDDSTLGLGVLASNFLEDAEGIIADETLTVVLTVDDPVLSAIVGELVTTIDVTVKGKHMQKTATQDDEEYTLSTINLSGRGRSDE